MEVATAKANVHIFEDAEAVAQSAAQHFVELARLCVAKKGQFSVALAGGSTPKRIYELLATETFAPQVNWSKVHIFFGDERTVAPDHADSNYRMANEALLSHVALPAQNVHRINGVGDAAANASLYESELRGYFGDEEFPRFSLVMLGMGDDGHTASLFPRSAALLETTKWVTENWVEKFNTFRITLSAPAINHAAHVMFIVTGAGKTERLPEVLRGERDTARLPSQLIQPTGGTLDWYVDKAAAGKL
ncbi:MAG: 6-phosphogluconolactonase [Pyrinomonadaceae bacterium]